MNTGKVYMLRHHTTGRMYIGRTKDIEKRIYSHLSRLRAGTHRIEDMQKDFDEYGENFTICILGEEKDGNNYERKMMEKYNSFTRGVGYNYKDPRFSTRKPSVKPKLRELIASLNEEQAEYSYNLLSRLFPQEMED